MKAGITIAECADLVLVSHMNGGAYTLRNKIARRSVFVQDDDATEMRARLDFLERQNGGNDPYSTILADLWFDYSDVAQNDE